MLGRSRPGEYAAERVGVDAGELFGRAEGLVPLRFDVRDDAALGDHLVEHARDEKRRIAAGGAIAFIRGDHAMRPREPVAPSYRMRTRGLLLHGALHHAGIAQADIRVGWVV